VAPEIGSVYARARELALSAWRVADLFSTVWGAWLVAFTTGDFASATRLVDELFEMANTSEDSALTLQAHHAAWSTFMVIGPLAEARHLSHADYHFIDVTHMASMHCNMGPTIRGSAVT
jgi:hypothetical protein